MSDTPTGLHDVAQLFLKLGFITFGGPAAHIAMMRREAVDRRGWVTDREFLDMVGATNLIPGPNSTEMALYLGHRRAGGAGLMTAGLLFILPAAGIVLALAWAYVEFGALPQVEWLLYGVKPVILAVVLQAVWALGHAAIRSPGPGVIALAAGGLYVAGVNEVLLLAAAAGLMASPLLFQRLGSSRLLGWGALAGAGTGAPFLASPEPGLLGICAVFFKAGALLYGSGYVLLAFLRADLVDRLGWLTDRQLLDAIAVGQFTPGPVFTTATFTGYLIAGTPGAAVATVAVFLPGFVFVALLSRVLPRLRTSAVAARALDGINAASLGLMGGVSVELFRTGVVDPFTALLLTGSLALVFRTRINTAWWVLGGGLAGLLYRTLVAR